LYQVLTRAFDVNAEVIGTDITVDQDNLDRLLRGQSNIIASVRRDENGTEINELSVNAQELTATAQGMISRLSSDVTARVEMADLSDAGAGYGGSLSAEAFLNGPEGQRRLTISGVAEDLELGIAELDDALAGRTNLTVIAGEGGDGSYNLEQLRLANPQLTLDGSGNFAPGELDARLDVDVPDLAAFGRGLSGALTATATAREMDGQRRFDLTGTGQNLRLGQQNVDGALTGTTRIAIRGSEQDGQISIEQARITNDQALIEATGQIGPQGTDLTAQAEIRRLDSLGLGWRGSFDATASFADDGTGARRLMVDGTANDLALGQSQLDAALSGPTRLQLRGVERNGVLSIEDARVQNPRLNATASGQVGQAATDLTARINAGDLRFLGNGIGGSLTADGRITDDGTTRRVTAQGSASGLRVGQEQADRILAGNTSFDLAASQQVVSGAFSIQRLNLRNPQLTVTGDGSPAAGLNLDARLADLGLLVPGFPGPAQLTGTMRQAGADYAVNLTATAPGGTRAQITGTAAQDFATTDLRISGISDAAVANPFLRTRSIEGPVNFDLTLRGPPGLESLAGNVRLMNGRLAEPRLGIRLEGLDVAANLNGRRINVEGAGNVSAGGRITVSGPVDLDAGTVDVGVVLDNVTVRDPNLYEALLNGSVRASGVMGQSLLISGRVMIPDAEIRIPSTGLGGSTPIPDITHVGDTRPVRATRAKAGLEPFPGQAASDAGMVGPPATPPANPPRLDLTIDAPNQIFIRGRGVDAEMGGQMRITGTSRNVIPVGMLELIRGRVDLLGKRFDLTEGRIELQGSMTPVIRLVAETMQDDVTTRIIIDGDASD
ncbi:MAG: translocation/assembly module TamB domain-containing protein, partial [Paracoccus sp. (in: a-proteobacteria)]|nr:translocation/assembly module TamB domain-containing protein [Paracoccus sp. (in: a-proteobacteria)]